MKNKKLIAIILSSILAISKGNIYALEKEKIIINNKEVFTNKILQPEELKIKDNMIDVLGFSSEKKFSIGFDTDKKEFRVYNQQNKVIHDYHSVINKKYFSIKVFSKNGIEKLSIDLIGGDFGTTDKLNTLKGFKYDYGDVIKLYHREVNGRMKIYGDIIDAKEDYSKYIKDRKNVENVFFQITEKGLKVIYPQNPIIEGANNIEIKEGTDINLNEGITAKDFFNNDITSRVLIEGNVDKNTVGEYTVKYTVTDGWEKTSEINRKITIMEKAKIEDNIINTCGIFWANPEFKIGFDDSKKEFIVFDQTPNVLHRGFGNIDFWSIRILNFNGEEKFSLKLKGIDTANSDKLDALKNFKYEYGDLIELWHKEPSKERIDGKIINAKHPYENRIEPSDNVRFEITKNGLKAIYNEAPIIKGIENITLKIGEDFDPLNGVSVVDDMDKALTVTVNGNIDKNNPGVYELIYTTKDRFGSITTGKRKVTVRDLTNLEKNIINIKDDKNKPLLSIKFNIDSKTINLTKSNEYFRLNKNVRDFIKIKIYDSTEREKLSINILGEDKSSINKLDSLQNFNFQYGDSIEFLQWETTKGNNINIEGNIIDSKSDYSKGINKNILNNTKFKITSNGLQAFYNEKPVILGVDDITIKVGDIFNPLSNITVNDDKDSDLIPTVTGDVDNNSVGTYNLTYNVKDKEGKETSVERTVTVRSNERPTILGVENSTIKVGDFFDNKLGITANDKEDGDLTSLIKVNGMVNLNKPGIYRLVYSVTDKDGNKSDVERIITVRSNDKPVITGINDIIIKVGDTFDNKLGITANDTEDGDLTSKLEISGDVKNEEIGVYPLVYSVTDTDGNKTSITREVTIRSNYEPIITGTNNITIKVGEKFDVLEGVSASDKEDGDLISSIKVLGGVQNESVGEYDLIYSVKDSDGNKAIESRKVLVRSNDKPQIIGNENTTIKVGDSFEPMLGIVAMDKEDGILTSGVKVNGKVDTSKEGIYDLIYSIIDKDSNESIVTRRVTVKSNSVPELNGVDNIEIKYKKEFNKFEGVNAVDKEDGDLTNLILVEGNVNIDIPGDYQLNYKVIDSDGNEKKLIRQIKVKSDERPNFNEINNVMVKQGEKLNLMEGVVARDIKGNDITKDVIINGTVDTEISGTYNIIYSVADSEGNKRSITRTVTVQKDSTPIIIGVENISLKLGEDFNYNDGILARDKEGNDLTDSIVVIGDVDINTKGEYKLVYSVTDKEGNEQIVSRIISVEEERDKGKEFLNDIVIKKGEEFDPLIGIEEYYDKNSIEVIGEINKDEEGTYNIIYSITDKKGDKKSITRKVIVKEQGEAILIGVENVKIKVGEAFDPMKGIQLGYSDKKEALDIKNNVKVEGMVDTSKPGVYNLRYTIKNKEGDENRVNRTITITNEEAPIIKGIENVMINTDNKFNPITGINIKDNKDNNLINNIKINGEVKQKEGEYIVKYSVTDNDGNTVEATRVITVRDMEKDKNHIKNTKNEFIILLSKYKYKILSVIGVVLLSLFIVLFKRRKREKDEFEE